MVKSWFEETMEIIEDLKKEKDVQEVNFLGQTIVIYPEVFSPKHFADSPFFTKVLTSIVKEGSFCEVGVGTGIISLFVALNGANKIVGTDINPQAVKNAEENFQRHDLNADFYEGDVLEPIPKASKFDYIFWNHPFYNVDFEVTDNLLKSILDQNFTGLETYFATAGDYLSDGGIVMLGSGEPADQSEIINLASKFGWRVQRTHQQTSKIRAGGKRPMELYVYEFTK